MTNQAPVGTCIHKLCEACLLSGVDPDTFIGQVIAGVTVDTEIADDVADAIFYMRNTKAGKVVPA